MRDIGKNIRTLRQQKGLTQEEFAQRLFVTRQTVSNYENGRSRPDIDTLEKIAGILDTELDTLIYGPPTPRKHDKLLLLLGLAVTTVLALAMWMLFPVVDEWRKIHYTMLSWFAYVVLLRPLTFLAGGWTLVQGLSLAVKLPKCPKKIWYGLLAVLILVWLPGLLILLSLALTNISQFPVLLSRIFRLTLEQPWIYGLLGAAVRFLRSPGA